MYLCRLNMRNLLYILPIVVAMLLSSCFGSIERMVSAEVDEVVASVDDRKLLRSELQRDFPAGLVGDDSVTFSRMYIDNWVLKQLKMERAEEVLSSYEEDIEKLVEGYRQSLIMRQLDQYYIDRAIDLDVTERQIAAHYRANAAMFKLDHNKVRGVVVKAPRSFRNTSTLTTALRNVAKHGDAQEATALAEKHSLQLTDMSEEWVSYSDFLSHLPTVRTRSYDDLLSKSGVQQMSTDDALFYFIITDVARKGEVAPLECIENDIRRMLYAERRSEIVGRYEDELRREAVASGRIKLTDSVLLRSLNYTPEILPEDSVKVRDAEEHIDEEDIAEMEKGDSVTNQLEK